MLKQRQRGEDRQQPGAIVEDHLPQLAALAAVQLVAEITLNMHQHVGVVFPRGGLLEDRHQLLAVNLEERFQILPFMQRGDERADLPVARLVMSQQLQLVAAVKGQQTVTGQAAGAQGVEFMQGENALDKILPQQRIVQPAIPLPPAATGSAPSGRR